MRKLQQTTLLALLFLLLTGFTSDPNGKANALYVNASKLMQSVKKETGSYTKALDLYRSAREKIDRITTDYAAANIAVALISEQTKIASLKLGEFEQLEGDLSLLAEAEQDPLACALLVAEAINSTKGYMLSHKAEILTELSDIHAKARRHDQAAKLLSTALDIARAIDETDKKSNADLKVERLSRIAVRYAELGREDRGGRILFESLEIAKKINDTYWSKKLRLSEISVKYAELGLYSQAVSIANAFDDAAYKSRTIATIASSYAVNGQGGEAEELFSLALSYAKTITSAPDKVEVYTSIAGDYAKAEQQHKATRILLQSHEVASTITDAYEKSNALEKIADRYIEIGQNESAIRIFSQAHDVSISIEKNSTKSLVMSDLAGKLAKAGQLQKAVKILSQAHNSALKIGDSNDHDLHWKAIALAGIAANYLLTGKQEKTGEALTETLDAVIKISDVNLKGYPLAIIVTTYAEMGDYSKAIKTAEAYSSAGENDIEMLSIIANKYAENWKFFQALVVVNSAKSVVGMAAAMKDISGKYAEADQQPNKKEMALLNNIVKAAKPMKLPWE